MTQRKAYAGIGSRQTPVEIQTFMRNAASQLEQLGLILRSGGADGADSAFEAGIQSHKNKEIFLPWGGFNGRRTWHDGIRLLSAEATPKAHEIAARFHPVWDKLQPNIRALHARNVAQVLGANLDDPVLFVLCWTPNGSGSGGTGQAIRIAKGFDIPVFDMGGADIETIATSIERILERI